MKKISLIALLFHCLTTITAQQPYSKAVNKQMGRVESNLSGGLVIDGKPFTLAERMKHYHVAGVSIAVIDNYQIVWAKGYGYADKKENRKVTRNTLFEPGSISKSLNAVGILKLAQQGKLDLYEDINRYLFSWKFPYDTVAHGKKITTAQLLTHTAGLGIHGFPGYHRDSTIPTVIDILDGKPPSNTGSVRSVTEPGQQQRYSGGGIVITQQMLIDLSRQSYEQYMYEQVLRPLGMTNSSYHQPPPAGKRKDLATGYKSNGDEVPGKYYVYPEKSAAGLWTTPTDICRYIIEMQRAYEGKSSRVLDQAMAKLHLTPYLQDVAMGTYIQNRNGEKYFDHTASNEGYTGVFIAGVANGKGVAVFANSDDATILFELVNSVALVYGWKGFSQPEQITTVPVHDTLTAKYTGEYILDGFLSSIRKENDGLYLWTDGIKSKMYFTSPGVFRNIELRGTKTFIVDNAGTVTGYSNTINGKLRATGQKIVSLDTLKARPGQLAGLGRHLLEEKNYNRAISFLSRGLNIEPSDSVSAKNLGHAYLFSGQPDRAIKLYLQYLKSANEGNDLKKSLKDDFEHLSKQGFDRAVIKKARELLAL